MKELKQQLLTLIEEAAPSEYDLKKLAVKLKLTKTSDFVMLNKALNELEYESSIIRDGRNKYIAFNKTGLEKGRLSVNKRGAGFLDLSDGTSIFIDPDDLRGAMNGDEVIVQRNKKSPTEGHVLKVLEHNTDYVIGTFITTKGGIHVDLDDEKLSNARVKVMNLKDYKIVSGLKARLKIKKYGKVIECDIDQIIGHKDDPGVDILSVLYKYNILPEFPEDALKQANAISQTVTEEQKNGRKDLTEERIVTIDGDDSKDFDDAISIKRIKYGWELGVHIADVSYYVEANSPLDIEAYNRGTSTYAANTVVPMLPHVLSNGICSLNPQQVRLTLTCSMKVKKDGTVDDYDIYESVIKSTERMTYHNVNKILDGDRALMDKYAHLGDMFEVMEECAQAIRERREKGGAIDFDKPEAEIKQDDLGRAIDIELRERGKSERIIEDFMIAANECVARHMKYLEYPCLYRVHESPMAKKMREYVKLSQIFGHKYKGNVEDVHPLEIQASLEEFKDSEEYPIISTLILRCMQKARYDAHCLGHFGLGLKEYLHFTSPIRRYPDLIVHRMLRKYCFNHEDNVDVLKNDEELMGEYAVQTSDRERASTDAEREVDDLKSAEYMENHIGERYEGVISSITKFGFFVELPNTIEGLVRVSSLNDDYYNYDENGYQLIGQTTHKKYKLGQVINVKCIGASKDAQTIDFEVIKNSKSKRR